MHLSISIVIILLKKTIENFIMYLKKKKKNYENYRSDYLEGGSVPGWWVCTCMGVSN